MAIVKKLRQTVQDHLPKTDRTSISQMFLKSTPFPAISVVSSKLQVHSWDCKRITPDVFKADIVQFMAATNCRSDSNVEWDAFHWASTTSKKKIKYLLVICTCISVYLNQLFCITVKADPLKIIKYAHNKSIKYSNLRKSPI